MGKAMWTKVPGAYKADRKKRRCIRKVSPRHAKRLRRYLKIRREFLSLLDNMKCKICGKPSTEVHHRRGRVGPLLFDTRYWTPTCFRCGRLVHERPAWAIQCGWLEKECWNKP